MKLIMILAISLSVGAFQESPELAEISRLENAWNEAHVKGDADRLDQLWSDDFVVIVPSMAPMTKADAIGVWQTGRMKFDRYDTSDIRIRIYDKAAVVTGRVKRTRLMNGRNVEDDWRFTKMYVKQANGWRVVAFHASL